MVAGALTRRLLHERSRHCYSRLSHPLSATGAIVDRSAIRFAVHVYVGDDASSDDIESTCKDWRHKLDIRYVRFNKNLGGHNLVAQWTRCIALSHEPWVWLFSDDDEMEPGCVQAWRDATNRHPEADLFHFDVLRIDALSQILRKEPLFSDRMTSRGFLQGRLHGKIASFAPDYVFRRRTLEAVNGFQAFPLAWCSDDATWIKIAAQGSGVRAVRGPNVRWRDSGSNISSYNSAHLANMKIEAALQFLEWLEAMMPSIPQELDDPDDSTLLKDAHYWFFQHARDLDLRFIRLPWWHMALRIGRMRNRTVTGTLLRMIRSDWRNFKMSKSRA